jgi:O-acetyl-ADP-ribose deacetylase (regulator of RNase III)
MIEFVAGNILEANVQAVVNTVNTVGIMGKGIALQFKKAYPEMFAEYEEACKRGEVETGKMHIYDRGNLFNPRFLINFPTKRHWKGKSKLVDIKTGLKDLVTKVRNLGITSIAIPPLGCGHGGLNWKDVKPLITEAFAALPEVRTLVYEPAGAPEPDKIIHRTRRPDMNLNRATVLRAFQEYGVLGYELTLLEAHKLLYFLQAAGQGLRLQFTKGPYGPYADNLRHVLHQFEGHFILGFGDGRNSPNTPLQLLPTALDEAERFLTEHKDETAETIRRLQRLTELIEGFESPYGLELLASVHWVITHPDEKATDIESTLRAITLWNERKRRVMKPEHIRIAWRRLRDKGWFQEKAV